ncbi:MAG: Gfo/Idh/MocA family oxidoreductase [Planctomycetes bacterium]|nr:Gfo/Idh/MocA family oxidoreductase [Planctomycetota bacterium]
MASGINTAIVGYGRSGKCFHAYMIDKTEGLNLYAVSTRNPEARKAAEKDYGVKTYSNIDDLLKDDAVQLVVIATPHNTHAELCIKAMDAGKHTVTDKIMCMNTREADAMIEASKRNDVMLSVFHNRRWDMDFLTIQKVINDGLLGPVFVIESTILQYGKPRSWRADKEACGGYLFDWGAHLADQAVLLAGCKPKTVYTTLQNRKWDISTESHHRTHIVFESGLEFFIELSRLCQIPKPRWYILGEEGTLVKYGLDTQEKYMDEKRIEEAADPPGNYAKVKAIVNGEVKEMTIPTLKGDWLAYYRNVSDVLNNGAALAVTPESVRDSVAIVEGAMKSAEAGQVVDLTQL